MMGFAMQFAPKSAQEIAASKLFARGTYAFQVMDATEKVSKRAGNQMIELRLRVTDDKGQSRSLTDYLVATQVEKLRHAALACGLLSKYEAGSLSDTDFRGLKGKLRIGIEKGKNGAADRNIVADYVP